MRATMLSVAAATAASQPLSVCFVEVLPRSRSRLLGKVATVRLPPAFYLGISSAPTENVEQLVVKKFHGVGPATAEKMHRLGIETGADLKAQTLAFLSQHFGKSGPYFYGIARGVDNRHVRPDRVRKSVGAEDTFSEDINDLDLAACELKPLAEKVWGYCQGKGFSGKTVTVKMKYSDFTQATRSKTTTLPFANGNEILKAATGLLATVYPFKRSVACSA